MARLSAADKWPTDIRALVGKLRGQGATIDQIRAKLQELDVSIPRSTLGREIKELDEVIADIRRAREIAEAIGTRIDEGSASSTARANVEILQALTQRLLFAARGEGGEIAIEAKDAKAYSEVLRNLASASKVDLDREIKLRDELRAKVDAALKAAEADASKGGGKPVDLKEALVRVRQEVYGIFS
jgi:hypothetical protein